MQANLIPSRYFSIDVTTLINSKYLEHEIQRKEESTVNEMLYFFFFLFNEVATGSAPRSVREKIMNDDELREGLTRRTRESPWCNLASQKNRRELADSRTMRLYLDF